MTFYTWERILFMACVWFSGDYQSTNPPSWPTVMGIKHSDERVAFRVIEFWSTSCEEEIEFCSHSTRSTLPGFVDFVAQIRTSYILSFRLLIMAILPRAFSSLLDSSLVRKRMPIRMNEIYPCLLARASTLWPRPLLTHWLRLSYLSSKPISSLLFGISGQQQWWPLGLPSMILIGTVNDHPYSARKVYDCIDAMEDVRPARHQTKYM
ncbi:hypothetical protein EV401DRAFT_1377963 [Pisolithus croceorrhizus]|nr:hypothetical protein EV401DRAFT_1377963 [Pisolithus croceorrhizus]